MSDKPTGRLLLRMPVDLHKRLSKEANENAVSLNQYIVYLLSRTEQSVQNAGSNQSKTYAEAKEEIRMAQNTESGRRGNEVGRIIGKEVASKLGITLEKGSNKGVYHGKYIVIKSARLHNTQFGITNKMMNEVEVVILAKEISDYVFQLYQVDIHKIGAGKPTASKGNSAGKVTNFPIALAIEEGTTIGQIRIDLPYPPNR